MAREEERSGGLEGKERVQVLMVSLDDLSPGGSLDEVSQRSVVGPAAAVVVVVVTNRQPKVADFPFLFHPNSGLGSRF